MDYLIFEAINGFVGKSLCFDSLAVFCAKYLGYVLIFTLFLFLLKDFKKYWPITLKALAGAVFARFAIVELIRFFWERPRPFVESNVNLLLEHAATSSFPSGHAAFYFAFSGLVYFYNKKIGLFFIIGASILSLSRVYAGIHWPSDILAGAVIGISLAWLIKIVSK